MKLNLKASNNANQPPADFRKPVVASNTAGSNSRVANLKRLKQRQFGEFCFDYLSQCKHNLSSPAYQACPLCKLTQQVTKVFFAREKEQREKSRLESNAARARLRRQLIYMWSMCQPSFYPTQINHDPFFEIMISDHLVEVLSEHQELFDTWFKTSNSLILKGQASVLDGKKGAKPSSGLDFTLMIRIIERRIRINDVGHIAATYIQARVRRYITQIKVRHMLLMRFEYIPESKIRGEIFYDSLKQRKWQRFPHLLANDRPATPRTIRRRINYENQIKDKRLDAFKASARKFTLRSGNSDGNGPEDVAAADDSIQAWWEREASLVTVYEYLVILRDLMSLYFHMMRSNGHTGPAWLIPSAPGLHSRALGLSVALQTLPSPALMPQGVASSPVLTKSKTKATLTTETAASKATATKTSSTATAAAVTDAAAASGNSAGIPTIGTPMLLRALFLLEQAARDALLVSSPEEAVALLLRSPELRGVGESALHITYDGMEEIWDGSLGFQPYVPPPPPEGIAHDAAAIHVHGSTLFNAESRDGKIGSSLWTNALGQEDDAAAARHVQLMPYGLHLRPLNPAFQNIPADGNTSAPITYVKPSAGQFFRLFYLDEDLLGITPSSPWVFYPEIHRYRDNIFNGLRKFANASSTRQWIHHQYQQHSQYRQRLLQRRHQIVHLRRRLRWLITLQRAEALFGVDEVQTERIVLASPAALTVAAGHVEQQREKQTAAPSTAHGHNRVHHKDNSSTASSKPKVPSSVVAPTTTAAKDKPPTASSQSHTRHAAGAHATTTRTGATPATAASIFAPVPEMIFPAYVDTNRDTYGTTGPTVAQAIYAMDRHRVNYLQDTYGHLSFLRKNPVFQDKLRRTQVSNNRANATNAKAKANASASSASVAGASTAESVTGDKGSGGGARATHGLFLHHHWPAASSKPPASSVPHDAAKDDDSLSTLPSRVSAAAATTAASDAKKTVATVGDAKAATAATAAKKPPATASSSASVEHPLQATFTSALAIAASDVSLLSNPRPNGDDGAALAVPKVSHRHHHHTAKFEVKPLPLLVGPDVLRLLSSIDNSHGASSASASASVSVVTQAADPAAAASSSASVGGHSASSATTSQQPPRSPEARYAEEYLKRLYEYSVNVHTCIRDRLEEAAAFLRWPEDDIGETGIPMPTLPPLHPHHQTRPQPDVDTYLTQLEAEITRLETAAIGALENLEVVALERNQGLLSDDARQRKEDREGRLLAAMARLKPGATVVNDLDFIDDDEEDEYDALFPLPTLLVVEVYVHLPSRPAAPTGAGAVAAAGGRRNGLSMVLPANALLVAANAATGGGGGTATDTEPSVGGDSGTGDGNGDGNGDDNSSIASGTDGGSSIASASRDSFSVNSATMAARKRNSMYGFVDPSAGFTPTVTLHQILGSYSCDDAMKTPEQLDCGLFSFDHFRAIYRDKQAMQQQHRRAGARGLLRQQSTLNPAAMMLQRQGTATHLTTRGSISLTNTLTPPAHLTVDNVSWSKEVNASSGVVLGQVLSQPTHKLECQFLYLAQAPSREYLDKTLPRKVKLWLGIAAPDKVAPSSST